MAIKKVGIIGFGSIAKKHITAIKKKLDQNNIFIISNQSDLSFSYSNKINDLVAFDPDLIMICSETYKHYENLIEVEKYFSSKIVFIEKPLFHKYKSIKPKKNNYLVGYNLRFHPIVSEIKKIIEGVKINYVELFCKSYLPEWRSSDYRSSYSSFKDKGGGVALDLSHEIDLAQHLFGLFKKFEGSRHKISNLEINSDDRFTSIGVTEKKIIVEINLNYFTKFEQRGMKIYGDDISIFIDFIKNEIQVNQSDNTQVFQTPSDVKDTYEIQINKILSNELDLFCNFNEALSINKLIDSTSFND